MGPVVLALVVLPFVLVCGGTGSPGFTQIASGPGLSLTFEGPLSGELRVGGTPTANLDAALGLYDPRPPEPPAGAFQLERRLVSSDDPAIGPWNVEVNGPHTIDLAWTGGCGAPTAQRANTVTVLVFATEPGAEVSVLVPLSNLGIARFQGHATGSPLLSGDLDAHGTWSVPWCGSDNRERSVGDGRVRLRWQGDPTSLRAWPTVPRGSH